MKGKFGFCLALVFCITGLVAFYQHFYGSKSASHSEYAVHDRLLPQGVAAPNGEIEQVGANNISTVIDENALRKGKK